MSKVGGLRGHFAPHFSHAVGMAVHDVGNYEAHTLEQGVVFALEEITILSFIYRYIESDSLGDSD